MHTRTGLVGKKLGMTRVFTEEGRHVPVTMICVRDCMVVDLKSAEKHGYEAVVVGYTGAEKPRFNKSEAGYFFKHKIEPRKDLKEFRVNSLEGVERTQKLNADHFEQGQFIDVTAVSKGKGFAGAMKRHNFGGMRASHGVSVSHRAHGSTGQCQDPGKVFKGKKMAGQMGNKQVTMHNLRVVKIDAENGRLFVEGAVPGHKGSIVRLRDAIKKSATK